jgi:alpha-galactosidase
MKGEIRLTQVTSMEKVVLIGAGSAVFTRGLVADLISSGIETDLALVDIDPAALEVAERLTRKMVDFKKACITVSAHIDRRDALPGATVVICTIGVGKRRAWEKDVFIPRKYGIYVPVGDTVGPGGSSRAMRMIPPMVGVAEDILELCPNALFFNYGNPMSAVCRAVRKATGANVIGLCHGVMDTARHLAGILGVPFEQIQYSASGINHETWFTHLRINGKDAFPKMREIARQRVAAAPPMNAPQGSDTSWAGSHGPFSNSKDPFAWQLMLTFGAFPAPLDRHVTEFFPQFFRDGSYYGMRLGVDAFSFEGTIRHGDESYAQMEADAFSPDPLDAEYFKHIGGEHEQVVDIVQSIRGDKGKVYSANLPNTGQVPNLPMGAVIESPVYADASGLHPIMQPSLPPGIAGALATRFQWVETIVEAALEGSRDKFIQALILDGYVTSLSQAEAVADDLLSAQAEFLPWY